MNNRNAPTVNVNGTKLRVRPMTNDEVIQEGDLAAWTGSREFNDNGNLLPITEDKLQCLTWKRSTQIGEKVSEYPSWRYLRVLSKFWK